MTRTNISDPNDNSHPPRGNNIRPSSRPATRASTRPAPQEAIILQPALSTSRARTNIRGPGDHRPLPRGIRPIPPPARPRTRASTRAASTCASSNRRPASQPRPPIIRPMPRPRPHPTPAARLAARLARSAARLAAQQARLATRNAWLDFHDRLVRSSLARVRDDMADYDSRYPYAVRVRTRLGAACWERLERERCRIAELACVVRMLDREELSFPRADLDKHIPKMTAHVRRACGDRMADVFEYLHNAREQLLAAEAAQGIAIQHGRVMGEIRELFHHQPYMWCVYNMYFPIRAEPSGDAAGRMTWQQLMDWAVWTFHHPTAQPSWHEWIRPSDLLPQPTQVTSVADTIWNAAMIEAFEDIATRFAQN